MLSHRHNTSQKAWLSSNGKITVKLAFMLLRILGNWYHFSAQVVNPSFQDEEPQTLNTEQYLTK